MRAKPNISESQLRAWLLDCYGLVVKEIAVFPIGNDPNTAVYRVVAKDGAAYFLKVRRGKFDETSATLPKFLGDRGITGIIAPIETIAHQLWETFGSYNLVLYAFVEGRSGFDIGLSSRNWIDLGVALKAIHDVELSSEIARQLPRETYSPRWRDAVRTLLTNEDSLAESPPSAKLAVFLRDRRVEIINLVGRAEELAAVIQSQVQEVVVCHADIHGRNVLIDMNGNLYIVDWDTAMVAPKERDLMFIGGGVGGFWNDEGEASPFFEGYGATMISRQTLAYYRYERIVEDIAVTSREILSAEADDEDRDEGVRQLGRQFLPGNVVEMAQTAYERLSRK